MLKRLAFLLAFAAAPALLQAQSSKSTVKPKAQAPLPDSHGVQVGEPMLKGVSARAIGPAVMGGRISDIAYDPENPWTFYVATAHGGLMKTTDNGASFSSLTEKEQFVSTGAVAVAPSNPKVIWLGTGEANDRNSAGWGSGRAVRPLPRRRRVRDRGRNLDGRGRHLDARRPRALADHRPDRRASQGPGDGVRRGARRPLDADARPGPLQDDRWG
jgi:hypothetical protein